MSKNKNMWYGYGGGFWGGDVDWGDGVEIGGGRKSNSYVHTPPKEPKIYMTDDIFSYVDKVIRKCPTEVMLIGLVNVLEDGYEVDEVYLPDQVCSSAETELTPEAVVHLLETVEDLGRAKCWIHSHASMKVFWSGTDEENIQTLLQEDFLVSIVGNHAGEYLSRVDYLRPRFHMNNLDLEVVQEEDPDLESRVEADLKEHVRRYVPMNQKKWGRKGEKREKSNHKEGGDILQIGRRRV